MPGAHNALNAAAALEACRAAGADLDRAVAALADFRGAGRRFELLGTTASGAAVYDDYAHHPTEVAATIAAARTLEPARWSPSSNPTSTRGRAACTASSAPRWRAPTSSPSSTSIPLASGPRISPGSPAAWSPPRPPTPRGGRPVYWLPDFATAEPVLRGLLRAGDLCLVMGAGDIDALGRNLVAAR